jgi:hypothetical protein
MWAGSRRGTVSARHCLPFGRRAAGAPGSCRRWETIALTARRWTSTVTFEDLLAEGTPTALARAAALYRGELLEGFALGEETFEEWLRAERLRLTELAVGALTRLADHQVDAGASEIAIQTASRLLEFDPLREETHRTPMRLYSRQGRMGAALRQYQSCVGVLRREPVPSQSRRPGVYRQILSASSRSPPPPPAGPPARVDRTRRWRVVRSWSAGPRSSSSCARPSTRRARAGDGRSVFSVRLGSGRHAWWRS